VSVEKFKFLNKLITFTGMEKKLEEKEDMYFVVYPSYPSK
jgi:hypothetical protein